MPGHKRKYPVRFSPKRIKKMMQKDIEVGRMSMAVPVIISQALEIFLKSLLIKTFLVSQSKLSNTLSVAHMKQCVESEKPFQFLTDVMEQALCQGDGRAMSIWSLYRNNRREVCVQEPVEREQRMELKKMLNSRDDVSSSSESELFICL
ncbi:dr1-associated corepressor [Gouania willdenowi]|uniref:Dr1-associated corepressor-like n=1 Tax=Gouania willdenowi TaxID=441366 RepID=A0A8C5HUH1_GOUWI|nr:dr1-associated corepressor-like [Gouania willdenowi]